MKTHKTMLLKLALIPAVLLGIAISCTAEEKPAEKKAAESQEKAKPMELQVLTAAVGVWDAEIEVWPEGPAAESINFKGVETNSAYGEYWIASDFVFEVGGQTMKIHSVIGYDLDRKKMVGTVIDDGPYAATMTGDYDAKSKTVSWVTKVKGPRGEPMVQKTLVTQKDADERVLVLMIPGKAEGGFIKFMRIKFVKRS